jgi:tetratricopeptide (TPR) repeat protein
MSRCLAVLALGCLLGARPLAAQRIQLSASLSELESRAKKDSNDAAAHYNVALAYWNAKRYDDVDSALHRAVRIDPEFAAAYMALAALPYARRAQLFDEEYEGRVPAEWKPKLEESERMYRRAVMIDPLVDIRLGYVMLPTQSHFPNSLRVLEGEWVGDYWEGEGMYFEGKYEESYVRFQRVYAQLNASSHSERLWNTLLFWHGLAAAHANQHEEAMRDFASILGSFLDAERQAKDSSLQVVPLRTNEYRYILGVMQQRAGHFNEAISLFRDAIQNDVGLHMAHVRLADIYEDHGMMPQAVAERRAAVDANPEDASLVLAVGKTLARVRQWADAEQALQQAAAENPRDPRIPYYLGIVEQQLNKPADARAAFTRFLTLAPSRYAPQISDAKQRLETLH